MGKYLKKFDTDSARVEYEGSENYIEPYVSYVEGDNTVHYNKAKFFCKLTLNDDSEVIIEGSGELTEAMINPYKSTLVSTEIGELCTSIGNGAFNGCSGLTSVTIGNAVTTIGAGAFNGCSGLTEVTIPNSVTSIGYSTFSNCSGLTSVTIGSGVTSVGQYAFAGCYGLTSIVIPSSVTSIGNAAFAACGGLVSIMVDTSNTIYDSRNNCNAIIETATNALIRGCNNTIMPNDVTSIGDSAFNACSGLTSVTIPSSVTSIDSNAFNSCSGLTNVTIEATTPPALGNFAFGNTNDCPIYVPSESVDTYKTANYNWIQLASRIQAIP